MTKITEPGVYPDITEAEYHADPVVGRSLSSTGARRIIPPGNPAKFKHSTDHPKPPTKAMNFGSAAHRMILGAGPDIEVIDVTEWRTNDAKAQRDKAIEDGKIPMKKADYAVVEDMAAALLDHPVAAALLDPTRGEAEQTIVWRDPKSAVMCRARLDWLPSLSTARPIFADYKTAESADPDDFARAVLNYGYHQQAEFYKQGIQALDLAGPDLGFLFVVQEKTPPYLVTVNELDPTAALVGRAKNNWALTVYAECRRTDQWPGYSTEVNQVSLPAWALKREGIQ